MRFLIDENVPDAVATYLEERGHAVVQSRDVLLPGSEDYLLAQYAHANAMIVVTWNHKHFQRLIARRPRGTRQLYRNAGRLSFMCPEPQGLARLMQCIDLIEYEYGLAQHRPDMRVIVEIGNETLTFR